MAGLIKVRIADVAEVKGGKRLPANANLVTTPTSHPYIRGRDIRAGKITFDDAMYVLDEDFEKIRRYTVDSGDVCITIVGNIGDVGITPPYLHGASLTENAVKLVNLREDFDARFLMYALLTPDAQSQMKLSAAGAAQPKLGIYKVNEIKIPAPPCSLQRRIAGILSAYDELMENCQRRIRILEEMARDLYREWFVHFRFPGHEKVLRVYSPLGPIPKGWEVRKLADFVTTKYGYTESTNAEQVGPKYLRGMDINKASFIDWSEVPYCPISPEDHEEYRLRIGDVVVIRMADPGKVGIVEQEVDAVFASYLIRVAPKSSRLSPYFLFHLMDSAEYYAYITGASTGTTRKSASAGVITDYQFVLPPQEMDASFEKRVSETRSLLTTLLKQTVNLRRTRDLLLPRLLSGQQQLLEKEDSGHPRK